MEFCRTIKKEPAGEIAEFLKWKGNVMRLWTCTLILVSLIAVTSAALVEGAQKKGSKLEGMWSNPPATTLGSFCSFMCTDVGIERLNALLDDPKNDARPFQELQREAKEHEREYVRARLTGAALKEYPIDVVTDPGFSRCEPWGVVRQMFAPHQLEIRQRGNGIIELHYGEWDGRRTVYMSAGPHPVNTQPSRMGYSVGHWEGETLMIETAHVAPNLAMWTDLDHQAHHTDQLRILERYIRSEDGKTLQLMATIEDPGSLSEPLVLKKIWAWAPESRIAPYKSCEIPTNLLKKE